MMVVVCVCLCLYVWALILTHCPLELKEDMILCVCVCLHTHSHTEKPLRIERGHDFLVHRSYVRIQGKSADFSSIAVPWFYFSMYCFYMYPLETNSKKPLCAQTTPPPPPPGTLIFWVSWFQVVFKIVVLECSENLLLDIFHFHKRLFRPTLST